MASKTALVNRPDMYEIMDLPSGASKITCTMDSRVPNCGTFLLHLEDHTVGNLLNMQLLKDPAVLFAAYQVPHPLENRLTVRVQTNATSTPHTAFYNALLERKAEVTSLSQMFSRQVAESRPGRRFTPMS